MFTIIGADGKEYGPVTADKLREWIASGRANAQTQVRRDGESAWSNLGSLPDFAGAFAAAQPPPPPAPTAAAASGSFASGAQAVDPKAYADAILARGAKLDFGAALSRGLDLLKSDYWTFVGITLVMTLVICAASAIPLAGLLLTGILVGGLQFYFVRKLRGEKPELGDCFVGFNSMTGALILGAIVSTVLIIVGAVCLILPGIYLAIAYKFTYLLVLDHKLDFWPAMEVSRRVITANWFLMFFLLIVAAILSALGTALLIIGVVFTLPYGFAVFAAAYEQLVGPRRA
ncbi:MAG: DUF4339 domain-containing protein [Opitutae bacterium]|nr:DUF4339 domain-containing protein [Opitutae bacterium]